MMHLMCLCSFLNSVFFSCFLFIVYLVYELKSDTVAVFAVLPRYYRGNGFRVAGIPVVVGTTSTGVPWEWVQPLPERYIIFGATVIL